MENKITLPGYFTPQLGLGCWQSPPDEMEKVIEWALDAGVRLIDTAYFYRNEDAIGKALAKYLKTGKVKREEIFITTKLPPMAMKAEKVEPYFEMSRKALGLDYVDLYIIHAPIGLHEDENTKWLKMYEGGKVGMDKDTDLIALWKAMEKLVDSGKAKAIGVSNFSSDQLEQISRVARIPISVNQVECNAFFQQKKLRETMDKLNIVLMAYGPLGSPGRDEIPGRAPIPKILEEGVVLDLAKKYKKSPAQILLRHLVQLGFMVIPKSVKQHRINENFDIFDFALTLDEMAKMEKLDKGSKGRSFDFNVFPSDDDPTKLPNYPIIPRDTY